jgi:hypothetical protein
VLTLGLVVVAVRSGTNRSRVKLQANKEKVGVSVSASSKQPASPSLALRSATLVSQSRAARATKRPGFCGGRACDEPKSRATKTEDKILTLSVGKIFVLTGVLLVARGRCLACGALGPGRAPQVIWLGLRRGPQLAPDVLRGVGSVALAAQKCNTLCTSHLMPQSSGPAKILI